MREGGCWGSILAEPLLSLESCEADLGEAPSGVRQDLKAHSNKQDSSSSKPGMEILGSNEEDRPCIPQSQAGW